VVVPDIAGYGVCYKKLIKVAELTDVSSSFATQEFKDTTALQRSVGVLRACSPKSRQTPHAAA
jgi:Lrp/AsnC family transcriptional regulator